MGFIFGPFALPFIILGNRKEFHGQQTTRGENRIQTAKHHFA